MFKTQLINPDVLAALAYAGHGSKVLITDANYPREQKTGDAEKIYLGLIPGLPTATDVLKAVHSVVEVERAEVMQPEDGSTPEIFAEFEEELGLPLERTGRFEYYDLCSQPDVLLAIQSGEGRIYANILLTIGVRK